MIIIIVLVVKPFHSLLKEMLAFNQILSVAANRIANNSVDVADHRKPTKKIQSEDCGDVCSSVGVHPYDQYILKKTAWTGVRTQVLLVSPLIRNLMINIFFNLNLTSYWLHP